MANIGLEGIRLTDIHGYDKNDYLNYYNNNIKSIKETSESTNTSEDYVGSNKYINHLIRDKMGNDWYDRNARGKSYAEKVGVYNALFQAEEMPSTGAIPTNDISNEITNTSFGANGMANQEGVNQNMIETEAKAPLWTRGDLAPYQWNPAGKRNLLQNSVRGLSGPQVFGYRDWFAQMANKPSDWYDTDINPERVSEIFNAIYNDNYRPVDEKETNTAYGEAKSREYKGYVSSLVESNPKLANDMFLEFENTKLNKINDYKNFQNTPALPWTPNEMKDIMSEYYAKEMILGSQKASDWLYTKVHDTVSKNQTFGQKAKAAILGSATNAVGTAVSALGIFGNILSLNAFSGEGVEGVSGFENFLYKASQNPLTKWGNGLVTTGSWWTDEQEERMSTGYNSNAIMRDTGTETDFWDLNTVFDLVQQTGFTTGASAAGTVMSKMLGTAINKTTGALARRVFMNNASKFARAAAWAVNAGGKTVAMTVPAMALGAGEGSIDTLDIMNRTKYNLDDYINNLIYGGENMNQYSFLDEYIKNNIGPEEFEEYYEKYRDKNVAFNPEAPAESQEALSARLGAERRALYEQYRRDVASRLANNPEVVNMINEAQKRAGARNLSFETVLIGASDMLFSNIVGGAYKQIKNNAKRAVLGQLADSPNIRLTRNEAGRLVAKAVPYNIGRKIVSGVKGTSEVASEVLQETGQTAGSATFETLADNYAAQYMLNMADPDAIETLSDTYWANIDAAQKVMKENWFSKEAIFSGMMAAVSSGLGNPTIGRGTANFINRRASGVTSKDNIFLDWLSDIKANPGDYWRNPYLEAVHEDKARAVRSAEEADEVNRWLANHKELATMNDIEQMYAWVNKAAEASTNPNSDADFRDALMGQRIAGIIMMDRIGARVGAKAFREQVEFLSTISESDAEQMGIFARAKNERGISNDIELTKEEKKDILDTVHKRASETYELYNKLSDARRFLNREFGEAISENTKDAWAFNMIMRDDWNKRISEIAKDVREAYNKSNLGYTAAETSSEAERTLARYGDKDSAKLILSAFAEQKRRLRENKKSMPLFRYKTEMRRIDKNINDAKSALNELSRIDKDMVITSDRISGLDAQSMAELLNPTNKERYSSAQQKEIDNFVKASGITNDILTEIKDASILSQRMESFDEDFKDIVKDQNNMMLYDNSIRLEAAKRMVTNKAERALRATNYETFEEEADKLLDERMSVYEEQVLSEVLGRSGFYKDWIKLNKDRQRDIGVIKNVNAYKSLDRMYRNLFDTAYSRALRDKDTSVGHILDIMADSNFRQDIADRYSIPIDANINTETVNNIVNEINNYTSNMAAIEEFGSKLEQENKSDSAEKSVLKLEHAGRLSTLMDREVLNSDREEYDRLFGLEEFVDYINGKRKNAIGFTFNDFVAIANLYIKTKIGDTIFPEDIFGSKFNIKSINEAVLKMESLLKERLSKGKVTNENIAIYNNSNILYETYKTISDIYKTDASLQESMRKDLNEFYDDGRFVKADVRINKFNGISIEFGLKENLTANEKKWYDDNGIATNYEEAVAQIEEKKEGGNAIFIIDDSIAQSNAIDSNDRPVVVCVEVADDTPNSFKAYGKSYIKVGLLQESRISAQQERNELDALRVNSIIDKNGIVTTKDKDGNTIPYVSTGLTVENNNNNKGNKPEISNQNETVVDVLTKTLGTNDLKQIIDELKSGENVKFVTVRYNFNERTNQLTVYYEDTEEKDVVETYSIEDKDRIEVLKEKGTKPLLGIVDKDGNLTKFFVKSLDDYTIASRDNNGNKTKIGVIEALSKINILSAKERTASSPIKSALAEICNALIPRDAVEIKKLIDQIEDILNNNGSVENFNRFIKPVIDKINKNIGRHINLKQRINDKNPYITFNVSISIYDKSKGIDGISLRLSYTNRDDSDSGFVDIGMRDFFGAVMDSNDIDVNPSISDITNDNPISRGTLDSVNMDIQRLFAKAILDEDMKSFKKVGGYNIAKPQVDYDYLSTYNNYRNNLTEADHNNEIEKVIGNDMLIATDMTPKNSKKISGRIQTETSDASDGKTKVEAAVSAIEKYRITKENNPEGDGIGATTFIKDKADDDLYSNISNETYADVAKSIGTSIDKLFRLFITERAKNKNASMSEIADSIRKWVLENTKIDKGKNKGWGSFPGISKTDIQWLINEFNECVVKTIESREETILTGEYLFKETIYNENGGSIEGLKCVPDMITVDKDGNYHIYDYKSVRISSGANSTYKNRNGKTFTIEGFSGLSVDKWQQQLNLYKASIEAATGRKGSVVSMEIIPIMLAYNPEGAKAVSTDNVDFSIIGRGVSVFRYDNNENNEVLITKNSMLYNNFINIEPMSLSKINSYEWTDGKSDGAITQIGETKSNVKQDENVPVVDIKQDDALDDTQCGSNTTQPTKQNDSTDTIIAGTDDITDMF